MPSNTNTRVNRYGALAAEIYDIDKPYFFLPDTTFHLETLAGEPGRIMEPACGTGRTLVPLLDAGHDVTGFDQSPDMLARCRARCAERGHAPNLSQQRFEDFRYPEPFAVIIMPVGTFTLIDDFAVAMSVLRRFRDHLVPGGRVILDLQSLGALTDLREDRRSWTAENGDLLTTDGKRASVDWLTQRSVGHLRYDRWRDNVLVESHFEPMVARQWGLQEFTLALGAAGFGEIRVIGSYDRSRPPRSSDRTLTFDARRL
ncbi:MAG TPA: class I SAM-dependent methyltransferase [Caulobacteraceae bacterium]|nr:class I SAM-dependent methyltransferase [Caulobacteraceae bacterium]